MQAHGLLRVGAAVPRVQVGNPRANAAAMLELLASANESAVDLVVFPELSLTGFSCADLFQQSALIDAAQRELARLVAESAGQYRGVFVVGTPLVLAGRLYNVAAVVCQGCLAGLVPKSHIPNYREFYERRWFTPPLGDEPEACVPWPGSDRVPFGTDLLFAVTGNPSFVFGVELCEDLWVPVPPSCAQALAGASLLVNLSASNEAVGKHEYRRQLVVGQSGRCVAGYLYCGAGVTESTTDLVFGGHALIAENGQLLAESTRFARGPALTVADIDLERLTADRVRMGTFHRSPTVEPRPAFRHIPFSLGETRRRAGLMRPNPAHPFIPSDPVTLDERCAEVFHIQTAGLAKRIEVARPPALVLGVSGGLDSTLALLVAAKTSDMLGRERGTVHGITMPGFGTSQRTRDNALELMRLLGVRAEEIDIRRLCFETFQAIGHRPFGLDARRLEYDEFVGRLADAAAADQRGDIVFENVQARMRTMLLMNRGFVIGTGDLSELALGWCTYNGDHMSMYAPNVGVPKTLVRFLVRWVADHEFDGPTREVLHSIADTEISPELLPAGPDARMQSTEEAIGPYELHDFFLFHFLRHGFGPRKILFLAERAAFDRPYPPAEIRRWLRVFLQRFFTSQFKRSCLPDGPKVGSVTLSPRGDWRMPSDAAVATWLKELDEA